MIHNLHLVREIQSRSDGKHGYIAFMERPSLRERGPLKEYSIDDGVYPSHQPHGIDVFFSALRFNGPRRNENVGVPGILFADGDTAPHPEITPTIMWETSTGNWQAVWYISDPTPVYDVWADLNQRMTQFTGADPGGWAGSKLLRVPGTVNWKRRDFGGKIWKNEVEYSIEWLAENLPANKAVHKQTASDALMPVPPEASRRGDLMRAYWDDLTLLGRSLLSRQTAPDRSFHIVRTARELSRSGISPEVAFQLLWVQSWCKWRTDAHKPEQLWAEILAVYDC